MKFTGELKKKLEAAGSKEEARKVLNDAGIELTDEELEGVAGGSWLLELPMGLERPIIPFNRHGNDQLDANPPIYAGKK